jgi:hypothetical protein
MIYLNSGGRAGDWVFCFLSIDRTFLATKKKKLKKKTKIEWGIKNRQIRPNYN